MDIPILRDVVVIFALSIVVLLVCHKFRLPSLVGFLITGILAGPHGFKLINELEDVRLLAEIGIVLLLFTVGLEVSIKKIMQYKRFFFIAGPIQLLSTIGAGLLAGMLLGRSAGESIFLGFLLSLSSTAIVMRLLQERGETDSPHGKLALGILIFQDIAVVPMMLFIPILSGHKVDFDLSILYLLAKSVLIIGITFFSAAFFVPKLLFYVAKTRSHELFLLTLIVICFAVAWITSSVGLSLALGAFLAGLVISESEYGLQAIGDILPFQDIFSSFFFVSIGMLLDMGFVLSNPGTIIALTLGVLVMKSLLVIIASLAVGLPIRPAIMSGMALTQIGEFSFVLAMSGITHHIGTDYLHQLFIATAVLTMGLTPAMISSAPMITALANRLPLPLWLKNRANFADHKPIEPMKDHLIIIGYGFTGKNLARSSKEAKVPYVIIEMNPQTVLDEKKKGEPIHFGDATREKVLKHVHINEAKAIAVLINDPVAAMRIVEQARSINPYVYIIVRTRYLQETQPLFRLGADDVIPDELGSSIEIFSRVLIKYDISSQHVEELIATLRTEGYEMLRPRFFETTIFSSLRDHLSDVSVKKAEIHKGSPVKDKTLKEIDLRQKYGISLLAIKRGGATLFNIDSQTMLRTGDQLIIVGTPQNIERAQLLFNLL